MARNHASRADREEVRGSARRVNPRQRFRSFACAKLALTVMVVLTVRDTNREGPRKCARDWVACIRSGRLRASEAVMTKSLDRRRW